jgi:hypothetical protein
LHRYKISIFDKQNQNVSFSIKVVYFSTHKGENVVAIVGSDSTNSKGMEVWNPSDESVTTFHDALPHEQDGLGLDGSQMISVDDGSELILYGGFAGEYLSDIWKYSVQDDSWAQVGNMTTTRYGHLVIPVTAVKCPEE